MGFLKRLSNNPLALLLCVMGGGLVGLFAPSVGDHAFLLGQIYLALVNMAALPLLVVATFFGLRQTLLLPQPGKRVVMIVALAIGLVVLCAVLGTVFGVLAGPGQNLSVSSREYLGELVQNAGGDAANAEIFLYGAALPVADVASPWAGVVPNNFFRVLAEGQSLGILMCAIFFGLAFAALLRTQGNALMGIFEAVYRALELIISHVNVFIPVMAFGMAAYFAAKTDAHTLHAMGSFLASFFAFTTVLVVLATALIWKKSGLSPSVVLSALKTPALISLTSASSTATIPDTIEAMSSRLGFSRGIVELVIPISSVFMRSGAALYFALLAVFVANIYGQAIGEQEFFLICLGASLAAFASAGHNSFAAVGFAGIVLSMLNLPLEAALALFLAIDLICEGPRNLLSLLFACVLIVLVSKGLPSERVENVASSDMRTLAPVRFVFSKASVAMALACVLLVAVLITIAGIGVGMRNTDAGFSRPDVVGTRVAAGARSV
ncbi:dicarboxylate/amino acid:cation symporter [Polaromonas sp. UC242_47]|uniref:dicarboxylate/amino acid:cation symporter n=1 Tax=Polaromonas sp. UC242_47 TaxID=3374626 RepID=UPI0037AB1921